MKRYVWALLGILLISVYAEAGTLTLIDGEVLLFETETEFVEILLEECLPLDHEGDIGYFIITDRSRDKSGLQEILAHVGKLKIFEDEKTQLYPNVDALKNSQEYRKTVSRIPLEHIFAVEVLLKEFDMVAVYALGTSAGARTRGLAPGGKTAEGVKKIIDAKGEGTFTILED